MAEIQNRDELPEPIEFVLRLYVVNKLPGSAAARRNVEAFCREYLKQSCDLKIIDISKHPGAARTQQIVATPTLVKERPLPVRRFVGDMSDLEVLLSGFGLR
jgi:circadian clock protein KaiB